MSSLFLRFYALIEATLRASGLALSEKCVNYGFGATKWDQLFSNRRCATPCGVSEIVKAERLPVASSVCYSRR